MEFELDAEVFDEDLDSAVLGCVHDDYVFKPPTTGHSALVSVVAAFLVANGVIAGSAVSEHPPSERLHSPLGSAVDQPRIVHNLNSAGVSTTPQRGY